jgi:hypothetical protein
MESNSFVLGVTEGLNELLFSGSGEDDEINHSDFYDELLHQLKRSEDCEDNSSIIYQETEPTTPIKPDSRSRCEECQSEFVSYKGMMQHKAKIHDRIERKVPCPQCGKCYKHKYALEFHVKQVHEKSTRVKCELCLKVLYNKYAYRTHMKSKHDL